MRHTKSSIILILLLCVVQSSIVGQEILTLEDYIQQIKEYHPYIKIANNKLLKAEYKLKAANGAFDPKVSGEWALKQYDGKQYYDLREIKLKVPTRLGVAPIVKYQNNEGYYVNPENTNSSMGLLGAGLEIPLLRGLRVDENRKEFRVQRISNERQIFSNDSTQNAILSRALFDYVKWSSSYLKLAVVDSLLSIRSNRYVNILNLHKGGFIAAMDTLDAYAQLQKTRNDYLQAKAEYAKTYYNLQNQLWSPFILEKAELFIPQKMDEILAIIIRSNTYLDISQHNYIRAMIKAQEEQEVEILFRKEQFKPQLNLQLLPLSGFTGNGISPTGFSANNFMSTINVELPLYYRKQSNYYRIAKLELENLRHQTDLQKRKLQNKYLSLQQNTVLYEAQYQNTIDNVEFLEKLRDLEEEKFIVGESSLIKLNLRENKYQSAQLKSIDTFYKYASNLIVFGELLQSLNK